MITASTFDCVGVIDDDEEILGSIGSLLRSSGYKVILSKTTDDFLSKSGPSAASCLVLDVHLSTENGLDFQESLARHGIKIPVILITGRGDIPMTVRAMRAGAIDFLLKPLSDRQMLDAVATAIEASKEHQTAVARAMVIQESFLRLTAREREVMGLVVTGLMNKQVASRMNLTEITVKVHRGNVMRKMAAQSLPDLVRMAECLGIRDDNIHRFQGEKVTQSGLSSMTL